MNILSSPLNLVVSTPPVTRAWTAATLVFSLLYLVFATPEYAPYFVLIPGRGLFYPWTFLTSALIETSIFELIGTLIFVPASLRYLERLWGAIEMIKFIVVSIVASNIIAFGFNWIEFIGTRNADLFLYGMDYHGQMALQIAILVAFTQLIPEHQVQVMGVIKARVKGLPMAYLTVSTVMTILGFQSPWIIIQFGWFVSWIYLRFYKKNESDTVGGDPTYGDRSETFALIYWFPPFAHYPLGLLGSTVFNLANRLHLIPSSPGDLESGGYSQVPGGARAEAERRRALALKALDQRMANGSSGASATSAASSPTAPRPPPAAALAQANEASTQSTPQSPATASVPRTNERSKSIGGEGEK